jgi:hypothetical protein
MIESVESIDIAMQMADSVTQLTIPLIKMTYWISWSDFDIDDRPTTILL